VDGLVKLVAGCESDLRMVGVSQVKLNNHRSEDNVSENNAMIAWSRGLKASMATFGSVGAIPVVERNLENAAFDLDVDG